MLITLVQYLCFIFFMYLWAYIPLRFLADPVQFVKLKNEDIKNSYWLFYSIDILYLVLAGLAMLVAGFYAEIKFLWLLLSIVTLAISLISLSTVLMRLNLHEAIDHEKEIEKLVNERLAQIPKKKRIAQFKIFISILWIYSWHDLFMF